MSKYDTVAYGTAISVGMTAGQYAECNGRKMWAMYGAYREGQQ